MKKRTRKSDRRGSVLLITMILTLGLAIFLGSFVKLAMSAYKFSNRSFHSNGCIDLAEAGLEEALFALNNTDWTGWTSSSGHMSLTIPNVALGQGNTGTIKVKVFDYATAASPRIVAEGRAILTSGPLGRPREEALLGMAGLNARTEGVEA